MKLIDRMVLLLLAAVFITPLSYGQAKWWWEKYPTATNKILELTGSSGGHVTTKQNPTGAASSVSGNAATQPPTVIIQQTSSSVAANPSGFCVNPSSVYWDSSYGPGALSPTACASLPGHNLATMTSAQSAWNRNTGQSYYPITACCYTPTATAGPGTPSYTPWNNNTAFAANGYSGTQHQDYITPGTHSFTVPNGVYRIWATVIAGGGGGGQGASTYVWQGNSAFSGGGGGRGGILYRIPMDVIPGTSITVRVGAGGVGAPMGQASSYSQPLAGNPGQGSFVASGTSVLTTQGGFSGPGGYYNAGYSGQSSVPGTFSYATAANPTSPSSSTSAAGGWPGYVGGGATSGVSMGPGQAGGGSGGSGYGTGNNGEGNVFNQSGAGIGGGVTINGVAGGGGGAAGFIGMPWSSGVPSGTIGTASTATYAVAGCYTKPGAGGFGYGAGGGGGAGVGYNTCGGASTNAMQGGGAGGKGADGAVWLEW